MGDKAIKKANILTKEQVERVLYDLKAYSKNKERDALWVMLSFRAGMRAQEIAYLSAEDFLTSTGEIGKELYVSGRGAKYGKPRFIPMSADLAAALRFYMGRFSQPIIRGPVFFDQFGSPMATPQGANAVQQHLRRLYHHAGFSGCSSHSGRRSFVTEMVERASAEGVSLKEVQTLAGHASIVSTEGYIGSSQAGRRLIGVE
jgi:integrase